MPYSETHSQTTLTFPSSETAMLQSMLKEIAGLRSRVLHVLRHLNAAQRALAEIPPASGFTQHMSDRALSLESVRTKLCRLDYPAALTDWMGNCRKLADDADLAVRSCSRELNRLWALPAHVPAYMQQRDVTWQSVARAIHLSQSLSAFLDYPNAQRRRFAATSQADAPRTGAPQLAKIVVLTEDVRRRYDAPAPRAGQRLHMELSREDRNDLHKALVDAFNMDRLKMLAELGLDISSDEIGGGEQQMYALNLIKRVEKHNQILLLVQEARIRNGDNLKLKKIADRLQKRALEAESLKSRTEPENRQPDNTQPDPQSLEVSAGQNQDSPASQEEQKTAIPDRKKPPSRERTPLTFAQQVAQLQRKVSRRISLLRKIERALDTLPSPSADELRPLLMRYAPVHAAHLLHKLPRLNEYLDWLGESLKRADTADATDTDCAKILDEVWRTPLHHDDFKSLLPKAQSTIDTTCRHYQALHDQLARFRGM